MGNSGCVSGGVSSRVSRGVSAGKPLAQVPSGESAVASTKARGPGPHLVRTGTSYIFQIRIPKQLGGGRGSPLVRLGIGARPAQDARRIADLLAAAARTRFDEIRRRAVSSGDVDKPGMRAAPVTDVEPIFSGETPEEVAAEMRGYLKAMKRIVEQEPRQPSAEETRAFEGLRGLVGIAREIDKGAEGNPLIVENADLLKTKYVDKFAGTALSSSGPGPSVAAAPHQHPPQVTLPPQAVVPARPTMEAPPTGAVPRTVARDEKGNVIPAFRLDRRIVPRRSSSLPQFSEISESYLALRTGPTEVKNYDINTVRFRRDLFIELIGDHPVDTYDGSDLQAYVELLTFWPGEEKDRKRGWTARQIIDDNRDLHLQPLSRTTFRTGYVGNIRTMMNSGCTQYGYPDPFAGTKLVYPATAAPPTTSEPLSAEKITTVFRLGVASGLLDEAMLPLLGHLTGRRLSLLVHLKGQDIRQKFPGVYVAQSPGVVMREGRWISVPVKTDASVGFFALHSFLKEIGFIDWAMTKGDEFLFPNLMNLEDPSKSASSYMQRLFEKAGIERNRGEVFHSLRGGQIDEMRDNKIEPRERRFQSGHALGGDEHDKYGRKTLNERMTGLISALPLNPDIDFSMFRGLDFEAMSKRTRERGRRKKKG